MTLFFISAALLALLSLAFILPSLFRQSSSSQANQTDVNIAIARERRTSLNAALSNGSIDENTYNNELSDLERSLAVDMATSSKKQVSEQRGRIIAAALITAFIPIAAGAVYLHLGNPAAVNTEALQAQALQQQPNNDNAANAEQQPALAELLPNLEAKLLENPEDINGWKLLGRSYLTIGNFDKAESALLKAYKLDDKDPDVLAQLAETSAMKRDGDLSGESLEYIEKALLISPEHPQSRWLMALYKQQSGEHETAIEMLESLKQGMAGDPEAIASIDSIIQQSRIELDQAGDTASQTQPAEDTTEKQTSSTASTSLDVNVTLSEAALAEAQADQTVFVYARASSGPPMPLAVAKLKVSDLPTTVTLDDSMAMMPAMTLSKFPMVTVGARISKSGDPIAAAGDWYAEQDNIEPANTEQVSVNIDTVR